MKRRSVVSTPLPFPCACACALCVRACLSAIVPTQMCLAKKQQVRADRKKLIQAAREEVLAQEDCGKCVTQTQHAATCLAPPLTSIPHESLLPGGRCWACLGKRRFGGPGTIRAVNQRHLFVAALHGLVRSRLSIVCAFLPERCRAPQVCRLKKKQIQAITREDDAPGVVGVGVPSGNGGGGGGGGGGDGGGGGGSAGSEGGTGTAAAPKPKRQKPKRQKYAQAPKEVLVGGSTSVCGRRTKASVAAAAAGNAAVADPQVVGGGDGDGSDGSDGSDGGGGGGGGGGGDGSAGNEGGNGAAAPPKPKRQKPKRQRYTQAQREVVAQEDCGECVSWNRHADPKHRRMSCPTVQ